MKKLGRTNERANIKKLFPLYRRREREKANQKRRPKVFPLFYPRDEETLAAFAEGKKSLKMENKSWEGKGEKYIAASTLAHNLSLFCALWRESGKKDFFASPLFSRPRIERRERERERESTAVKKGSGRCQKGRKFHTFGIFYPREPRFFDRIRDRLP